jgi:hypothetical protein
MDGFHEGPYNVIQRFIRPVPGGLLMYNRGNIKSVVPDTTAIRALSDWTLLLKSREASPLDSAFQWDEKVLNHCDVFDRAGNYVMD